MDNRVVELSQLFKQKYGVEPQRVSPMPLSGSDRVYFRVFGDNFSVIGAYNPNLVENRAFFSFTKTFGGLNLPVPELLAVSANEKYYLQQDLGDTSLLSLITADSPNGFENVKPLLINVLELLAEFQVRGANVLDYSLCYPKADFDRRSVMWDLNYFKYSFLKPAGVHFNEDELEDDFESLTKMLLNDDMEFFLYRDFQSRNVMVTDGKPYFIDYQGGRRGPCLYDVVSFLFQAKAGFPPMLRAELLDVYLAKLASLRSVDKLKLWERFHLFALFRVIQTLGAYGFRGLFEGKAHFIQSIPMAIDNLVWLSENSSYLHGFPSLYSLIEPLREKFPLAGEQNHDFAGLTIDISSFSLKKGYPQADAQHGGGFIFDCRFLPNPGRLPEYRNLTGLDAPIQGYLESIPETAQFANRVEAIVLEAVEQYQQRGFEHLSVGFGCTGGQHRSVYFAQWLANLLSSKANVRVKLQHVELEKMGDK